MKLFKIFTLFSIVFLPILAHADVYINEIMYDLSGSDTGREWVEIYNSGPSAVDVSSWKFQESSSASNHALSQVQGTTNISAGGFAVIVNDSSKFLLDWPSFSGNLLKASFSSFNNAGSTFIIKDGSVNIIDQVTYSSSQGSNGDGNTLQKTSNGWISAVPTPGLVNSFSSTSVSDATTTATSGQTVNTTTFSSSEASAYSSPVSISESRPQIAFEVSAGRDRLASVGVPILFKALPTRMQNVSEQAVTYEWSFGDGTTAVGAVVKHAYRFVGNYEVVLNAGASDLSSVSMANVKVILPEIVLAKVPGGVEVSNRSSYELNLEGWTLFDGKMNFVFPRDTLIKSGNKITFADVVTGGGGNSGIKLFNPAGQVFSSIAESGVTATFSSNTPTSTPVVSTVTQIKNSASVGEASVASTTVSVATQPTVKVAPSPNPSAQNQAVSASKNGSVLTANTAIVFEAPVQRNFVSSIFSLPIKGFNFVRHLFVED